MIFTSLMTNQKEPPMAVVTAIWLHDVTFSHSYFTLVGSISCDLKSVVTLS